MLYGRPTGIPYGEFSEYQDLLPREVDDEHISRGHEQPVETPSMNSFFRHSVRLYHVMDDVLLRLRNAKTTAYFDIQKSLEWRTNQSPSQQRQCHHLPTEYYSPARWPPAQLA